MLRDAIAYGVFSVASVPFARSATLKPRQKDGLLMEDCNGLAPSLA
jgi:hypothetical protein